MRRLVNLLTGIFLALTAWAASPRPIVINPTPRSMELTGEYRNASKLKVTATVGPGNDVKPRSGAYTLTIGPRGARIHGYDERGVFYGRQTLARILESVPADSLPCMTVNDWPEIGRRGVVEGFYGAPWSHEVRLSLIDFYGRNKLNTYIYGPKDDPYHSSPHWREPYPADQARNIRELVEACGRNHVDFVWAIHPGKDIRWDKQDYDSLLCKFEMMYDLGVRSFAIFFDDIEGEGTNPYRQCELLNNLTEDFVRTHKGVSNLAVCPTDYSRLWANPTENGASAIYGRTLLPEIDVMYTGDFVCSDLTRDTMDFFNALVKRPGFYWWNWPVTDYARNYLLQGPAYGLDTSLTESEVCAVVSNPMEHGEASKLGLYGVADYSWNPAAYDPAGSWERGLRELMPDCYEAYRTFAIHNCDTETGYRRDESWQTETFRIGDGKAAKGWQPLMDEFQRIAAAPAEIRAKCGNRALLAELEPWLAEFEKLGRRGIATMELIRDYKGLAPEEFSARHAAIYMTPADRAAYVAHKSGSLKLQPFIDRALDDLLAAYSRDFRGW
ncbi:MAG: beta-N-acetylglucosaminidase domain-containing protein [Muribaculaceae bacterium]|nr:beta-N-acetylglucosaminidase domain-containing protein [Muribaculaceae bacterium]